jgi:hypothetical protein
VSRGERIARIRVLAGNDAPEYQLTVSSQISLRLRRRGTISIPRPAAFSVKCVHGALWITQAGDLRDRILTAGEAFRFDPVRAAQIVALGCSQLLLYPTAALESNHWFDRLAMQLRQAIHRMTEQRRRTTKFGRRGQDRAMDA